MTVYDEHVNKTYILEAGDYYLSVGLDAHDAVNNILAAKGYAPIAQETPAAEGAEEAETATLTANGAAAMDAPGDAAKVYKFTVDSDDNATYSVSGTGYKITNQFGDADLNSYGENLVTYLSRSDWQGTWPEKVQLDATQQMMDAISNYDYEQPADAPSVDDFTQGADNGLKLTDMIDVDYDDDETWNKFLDQLTVEQLCNTVTDSKSTNTISTLDVPGNTKGDDDTNAAGGAIQFVSHPLTARTWNTDMNEKRGLYEGLICTLNGKDEIWYGAGNLHRHPYGGRAGQYWSEDATLDYYNGYYEAQAAQSVGCITCVKHMACNDQEAKRTGLSVFVDEQALREIYLRAFEGAFDGGALSVMTTTGRIGTRLGKNYSALLTTVLRDEWGFQGHVTSDGYVNTGYYNNTLEELEAGMDYSCCDSAGSNAQRILNAIKAGDGNMLKQVRRAAKNNLYVMTKTASMNGLGNGSAVVAIVPAWEMAVAVTNIVVAVLLAACLIMTVVQTRKNGKTKKEEIEA